MGVIEIFSQHRDNKNTLTSTTPHGTTIQEPTNFKCCHANGVHEEGHQDPCMDMEAGRSNGGTLNQGTSTFLEALTNCVSLLYGLGILSSPYAVAHAGWGGVAVSLAIAFIYWYTSTLVCKCMSTYPHLRNYQDIAQFAFGKKARFLITILFYAEIFGTLVGYSISVGDNLDYIFPNVNLHRLSMGLSGKKLMIVLSSLVIMPTVWIRDLSALSRTTVWCVASSVLFIITVFYSATVNHIGFTHPIPFMKLGGVPVAAGLYAFSYGGTAVFPTVYASMKNPAPFYKATVISFVIATTSISGLGVMGAYMFGIETASQITLSMPPRLVATKIVLWMTVITPITKFALILSPVSNEIEGLFPWNRPNSKDSGVVNGLFHHFLGTLMRTSLLLLITLMALTLPYFNYIVALIGSSMTIMICMVLPCLFYLKIFYRTLKLPTILSLLSLLCFGFLIAIAGTISSCNGLIKSKSSGNANP